VVLVSFSLKNRNSYSHMYPAVQVSMMDPNFFINEFTIFRCFAFSETGHKKIGSVQLFGSG